MKAEKRLKEKKVTRVMGFGTFDGIHPGHLNYLMQLKSLGDEIIVVISRDKNVVKFKGKAAKLDERKRLDDLRSTQLADQVILGNENDIYQVLRDHKPNVIGLGYDQKANENSIRKILPSASIVKLKAYQPEKYKSSLLLERNDDTTK